MDNARLIELVRQVAGHADELKNAMPLTLVVDAATLTQVCERLHKNPETYFDMLTCITGVDNGPEANTMEVIYHLYSIPFHQSLMLKVIVPRENPEVETLTTIWKSANWLEREVFDMFGIVFKNHPDLRRILMPADWNGYPLRKDYQHEETYRGIKID
ncbi:MAG TPA: NADH-quinone oxidoreductase subunit C [Cytophagales bacterium]|nr:NADH-quinone oxidoreductase subunit C [Cytophagales bacterium]HRG08280.1 NADH-quinone oxidoreductase subunit C [Cyclobacteriaceae bacterium]